VVDDLYFLNGELLEVYGSRVLMDSEEAGLVWVGLDQEPSMSITIHSIVRVQFNGVVAESYPAQASGHSLEVVKPFQEEVEITFDEMNDLLADGDVNHVIVWNKSKDTVAYATLDLDAIDGSYKVYISNVYEGTPIQLAYVKGEIPDLNWFYGQLEIQTASGGWSFGPLFEEMETPIQIGRIDGDEIEAPPVDSSISYTTVLHTYEDQVRNISIEYFQVEDYLGELVQDYMNQSLYKVVETYSNDYEDVVIKAEVLKEDDYLTVAYKGEHQSLGYEIEGYVTMDVATATVLTVDNLIKDKEVFEAQFEDVSGYKYEDLEGVVVYLVNDSIILTFVPTDDSAKREHVEFHLFELAPIINTSFEMPAS